MTSWILLAASLVAAACTLSALLRGRHLGPWIVPYFFVAWLTGELALHHLAWQALAALALVAGGALEAWPGPLGLGITLVSWIGLLALQRQAATTSAAAERALQSGLGRHYRDSIPAAPQAPLSETIPARRLVLPFRNRDPSVERRTDIPYGPAGRFNWLDVYRPRAAGERRPVLLQIHGGGWMIGYKRQQALPLMYQMASRGWICVAPSYRLSPRAVFPEHLIDVKRALVWIREHAEELGADPDFVAVTGGSAGGHLAALVGLTAGDPEYQPGFEGSDTSVAACVPFYGIYDLLERTLQGPRGRMRPFLERFMMQCRAEAEPLRWERASPVSRVHADAPPFLVIHGSHDSLAPIEDARAFVEALRARSAEPVVFVELAGGQHAFDVFHSLRCEQTIAAVGRFLEYVHAGHAARQPGRQRTPPRQATSVQPDEPVVAGAEREDARARVASPAGR